MALNLLPNPGNKGVRYGLLTKPAEVIDNSHLSKYFVLSEFNPKFTAGKNSFQINGSVFLEPNSEILIECIDSSGENLYIEMARTSKAPAKNYVYKESTSFVLAIHVYGDTSDGIGKLILYGTLRGSKKHVRWYSNISIDKTLGNISKVRFYKKPTIDIQSLQVPVVSTAVASTLKTVTLTGQFHGSPVNPIKDTNYNTVNKRNIDIDYRIILDTPPIDRYSDASGSANVQMGRSTVDLTINTIQEPFSNKNITPANTKESFTVKDIFNNSTIQISDPYVYTDTKKNKVVVPIINGSYSITFPYISYNTATSSYLTTNLDGVETIVRESNADITYRNIKTFSGYVARHKVYRKSLLSNSDFQIVTDEPLYINEFLRDNLTQNKFYELLGKFYNPDHIRRYWFTSSNDITMSHVPDIRSDSVKIDCPNTDTINGSSYVIVKNDSSTVGKDATYKPYNETEYLASSGSFYDSNFIPVKKDVEYILSFNAIMEKNNTETDAKVEFYYTSSVTASRQETTFSEKNGILIGTIKSTQPGATNKNITNQIFFFTPHSDLYGTLTIVPYKCKVTLWDMSFRVYGDAGISPDVFTTRIAWPISVANENFDIKAELFDINSNLIYSELRTFQNFDISGSSLVPYIPGSGIFIPGSKDVFISGSLYVSQSFYIWPNYGKLGVDPVLFIDTRGQLYMPEMDSCVAPPTPTVDNPISASRFVRIQGATYQHKLCRSNIVNIEHDSEYMYLSTGSMVGTIPVNTDEVSTKKSLVSEYIAGSGYGRRVFIDSLGVVQTES
jgi:hypothetical protein